MDVMALQDTPWWAKPTERDHSLAYGIGITEVSTKVQNEKIVLYDSG